MLTKRETEILNNIVRTAGMPSNLYVKLARVIKEMMPSDDVLLRMMNEQYTTHLPLATDEEVAYAAAADGREEVSFVVHKAMARELIQRRK